MIFLKKQKISLEELYGYASSDEESDDNEVPPVEEAVDDHDSDVNESDDDAVDDANNGEQMNQHTPLCDGARAGFLQFHIISYYLL